MPRGFYNSGGGTDIHDLIRAQIEPSIPHRSTYHPSFCGLPSMDPVQILQTTLNGFLNNQAPVGNESASVASNITGAATANPLPIAVTPATILSLFLSFSALRDWLKLIVIGGVVETSRRLCLKLWSTFIEAFWITASFEEHDDSYSKSKPLMLFLRSMLTKFVRLDIVLALETSEVARSSDNRC